MPDYDVVVVGGGPAGLSAALVLGRCRRRTLVVDAGQWRNAASRAMHNYLSRDGVRPGNLLTIGREEIARYGVEFRPGFVEKVRPVADGHEVCIEGGLCFSTRAILLATGVRDMLPAVEHVQAFYGLGVHHCPYCDAWPYRDKPMAAYGRAKVGRRALGLAENLLTWTPRVTALTDGAELEPTQRRRARRLGIAVRTERLARLLGPSGPPRPGHEDHLAAVEFVDGPPLVVDAFFFNTLQVQRSGLATQLGCKVAENGGVERDARQRTCVPGVYVAGDASRDVQFVVVAAAEGAKAATAINADLHRAEMLRGERLGELRRPRTESKTEGKAAADAGSTGPAPAGAEPTRTEPAADGAVFGGSAPMPVVIAGDDGAGGTVVVVNGVNAPG